MMNKSDRQPLPKNTASLKEWEAYNPPNWINSIVKRMAIAKLNKEKKWFTIRENETLADFYKRVGIKYSLNEKSKEGNTTIMMSNKTIIADEERIDDTVETMVHNLNRRK